MTSFFVLHRGQRQGQLAHWAWCLPVLLIVAHLSIRQIEQYPPTVDEFFSMNDAGWLAEHPYSPVDIIDSLKLDGPQHTPGYFMLLSLWGSLTSNAVAVGRVLTTLTGLLSLAVVYRVARDFIGPAAGVLALLIVASNTFYDFYFAHMRMYPLLVLCSGVVLWIYLRMTMQSRAVRRSDFLALFASVFALVNTHAFSALFLLMLGVYHLVVVPKNRHWIGISLSIISAVILFSPYAALMLGGYGQFVKERPDLITEGLTAATTWLTLTLNNSPALLLLSVIGLVIGIRSGSFKPSAAAFMFIPYLLFLALVAEVTEVITTGGMRYQLAGLIPFAMFYASGLYALYRWKRILGLLVILWVVAGMNFLSQTNWWNYLPGRTLGFFQPPTQVISRLALEEKQKPVILGYPFDSFYASFSLQSRGYINYSQGQHFFGRHNIVMQATDDLDEFAELARLHAITSPSLWHVYRQPDTSDAQILEAEAVLGNLLYEPCNLIEIGNTTIIVQYAWKALRCELPQLVSRFRTDVLEYEFFGTYTHGEGQAVFFVDRWNARNDANLALYNMSYQLLSDEWDNVAQLDLPLVNEGRYRLFSIDAEDVTAGNYRLVAILYNNQTGERIDWTENESPSPNMLTLEQIVIPEG